jgi:hypothetical protein
MAQQFESSGLLDAESMNDIAAHKKGDAAFRQYVGETYDSSDEFWKVKVHTNGRHEFIDDRSKNTTLEYVGTDENGNEHVLGRKLLVDGSNMTWSQSLVEGLGGLGRAGDVLGKNLSAVDTYDDQTLLDVTGHDSSYWESIAGSGGDWTNQLTGVQKERLAGEAVLKRNGGTWDQQNKEWTGINEMSLTLFDQRQTRPVNILRNADGTYNFSTVGIEMIRSPKSYGIMASGTKDPSLVGLDTVKVTQYDLNGSAMSQRDFGGWTTVQTMLPKEGTYNFNTFQDVTLLSLPSGLHTVKVGPETIRTGEIAWTMMSLSQPAWELGAGDTILAYTKGQILAGNRIGLNGTTSYAPGAFMVHPTNHGSNSGCAVTSDSNGFSGPQIYKRFTSYLKDELRLSPGYTLSGYLRNARGAWVLGAYGW